MTDLIKLIFGSQLPFQRVPIVFDGKDKSLNIGRRVRRPCQAGCVDGMKEENGFAIVCPTCRGTGSTDLPVPKGRVVGKRDKLAKKCEIALRDIGRWKDLYIWSQPQMVKLAQFGFVERVPDPPHKDIPYWRITEAGLKWLQDHPPHGPLPCCLTPETCVTRTYCPRNPPCDAVDYRPVGVGGGVR